MTEASLRNEILSWIEAFSLVVCTQHVTRCKDATISLLQPTDLIYSNSNYALQGERQTDQQQWQNGIIETTASSWASNVVLVK